MTATTFIDVRELSTRFAELLALARAGNEVIVTENDAALARLVPLTKAEPRVPGLHPGAMSIAPDFDDPLPEEFWVGTPIT